MNKLTMAILAAALPFLASAAGDLASNVYARVRLVFTEDGVVSTQLFHRALGGGIVQERMTDEFISFCNFVSNNCAEIAADWHTYETNEMVRFTTQSAVCFSGFDNQTNFANRVLALYEANTNAISWSTIEMIRSPDGPSAAAHYLGLHYDTPGVSNIIMRLRSIAVNAGVASLAEACDEDLSGETRQVYLGMEAAGAIE